MGEIYELHADEAWTHEGDDNCRYCCFFGGVFGKASALDRLQSRLSLAKMQSELKIEKVNWKFLSAANAAAFQAYVDAFFTELEASDLKYRQMFLDRSFVRVDENGTVAAVPRIDLQFKIYYQFLKHAFWLQALPPATASDPHLIRVKLDQHSSKTHGDKLIEFAARCPSLWGRPDLRVEVVFIRAKKSQAMQACDVLCGAAGSYGNKMHQRRDSDHRGMSGKQKVRVALARYIYNKLRTLDAKLRGSKAFNWFETTGANGLVTNRHDHKVAMWKFIPARFKIDKGWQNDNLDKHGRYQGSKLVDVFDRVSDFETY